MAYKKTLNFSYFVIKALYSVIYHNDLILDFSYQYFPPRGAKFAFKSHLNDKINHFLSLRLVEITKGDQFN